MLRRSLGCSLAGGASGPAEHAGRGASRARQEAAFRAFYDRQIAQVLHFLRFQVKDDDRPDVASRTFEIAARDFHKFVVPPGKERERAERNWVLTIARNAAASFRQQARPSEEIDEETVVAPGDLERDTAAFELAVALLWTLPEHLRTMYLLHERDGLTHEEIAEQLTLPLGTVKTQLRAAQESLDATIARMCARR
jgi:RNA polymerase sigma-70 factor (ECF subfamily)